MRRVKGVAWIPIIIAIALVVGVGVVGYGIYAKKKGKWPFLGSNGDGISLSAASTAVTTVAEDKPPSLLVEIREDKITYDGKEISLDELDEVLQKYKSGGDVWKWQDVYHADKATCDGVKELFGKHNVALTEKLDDE